MNAEEIKEYIKTKININSFILNLEPTLNLMVEIGTNLYHQGKIDGVKEFKKSVSDY